MRRSTVHTEDATAYGRARPDRVPRELAGDAQPSLTPGWSTQRTEAPPPDSELLRFHRKSGPSELRHESRQSSLRKRQTCSALTSGYSWTRSLRNRSSSSHGTRGFAFRNVRPSFVAVSVKWRIRVPRHPGSPVNGCRRRWPCLGRRIARRRPLPAAFGRPGLEPGTPILSQRDRLGQHLGPDRPRKTSLFDHVDRPSQEFAEFILQAGVVKKRSPRKVIHEEVHVASLVRAASPDGPEHSDTLRPVLPS